MDVSGDGQIPRGRHRGRLGSPPRFDDIRAECDEQAFCADRRGRHGSRAVLRALAAARGGVDRITGSLSHGAAGEGLATCARRFSRHDSLVAGPPPAGDRSVSSRRPRVQWEIARSGAARLANSPAVAQPPIRSRRHSGAGPNLRPRTRWSGASARGRSGPPRAPAPPARRA